MEYIQIQKNGQEVQAMCLIPELTGQLAIVDFKTLQRITSQLQSVPFHQLRSGFVQRIEDSANLAEMVDIAKEEVAFHETVNLITTYEVPVLPELEAQAASVQEDIG